MGEEAESKKPKRQRQSQPIFNCGHPNFRTPKNGETYCTSCGISEDDHP